MHFYYTSNAVHALSPFIPTTSFSLAAQSAINPQGFVFYVFIYSSSSSFIHYYSQAKKQGLRTGLGSVETTLKKTKVSRRYLHDDRHECTFGHTL